MIIISISETTKDYSYTGKYKVGDNFRDLDAPRCGNFHSPSFYTSSRNFTKVLAFRLPCTSDRLPPPLYRDTSYSPDLVTIG